MLPLVFWILLWIGTDLWKGTASGAGVGEMHQTKGRTERYMPFIYMLFVNMTAGICSSMGVVLAAGMSMLSITGLALARKKPALLVKTAASLVPSLVYIVLYVML